MRAFSVADLIRGRGRHVGDVVAPGLLRPKLRAESRAQAQGQLTPRAAQRVRLQDEAAANHHYYGKTGCEAQVRCAIPGEPRDFRLVAGMVAYEIQVGSCHKRQKPQAPTPQASIRNSQTRKVANAKGLNRNTNLA